MSSIQRWALGAVSAVVVVTLIGVLVFGDSVGAALGIAAVSAAVLLLVTHFRAQ